MTRGSSACLLHRLGIQAVCIYVAWLVRTIFFLFGIAFPVSYTSLLQDLLSLTLLRPFYMRSYPDLNAQLSLYPKVDCLVRFEDGTFGIVDFKTSNVGKSSEIYSRQLHAYARAIEDPASGSELIQGTVSDMSLVVYTPNAFHTPTVDGGGFGAALTGDLTYVNMPRDDAGFDVFLSEVLDVLTLPAAPPSPPPSKARWSGSFSSCPYCQFLHDAKEKGFIPGHVDE